ncbi:MAG: DUF2384 domain-containing protein [Nitrospinota bacterium]|nr:DUF2384 domain-containing protein [Nitrospinota bacterium]
MPPSAIKQTDTAPRAKERNRFIKLRGQIQVTRKIFSRLLSVSERLLADIETDKTAPTEPVLRKLREMERLTIELRKTIDPDFIGAWLSEPNNAFDGSTPVQVIERGEIDRIWQMIYFVRSGTPT